MRTIISKTLAHHHSDASLLHGDLWGGNYMFTADGQPALIDPAAVYGDRELDIGVTTVLADSPKTFTLAIKKSTHLMLVITSALTFTGCII